MDIKWWRPDSETKNPGSLKLLPFLVHQIRGPAATIAPEEAVAIVAAGPRI